MTNEELTAHSLSFNTWKILSLRWTSECVDVIEKMDTGTERASSFSGTEQEIPHPKRMSEKKFQSFFPTDGQKPISAGKY